VHESDRFRHHPRGHASEDASGADALDGGARRVVMANGTRRTPFAVHWTVPYRRRRSSVDRHFISIEELSDADLESCYRLRARRSTTRALKVRASLSSSKRPSLRTRASVCAQLGGFATSSATRRSSRLAGNRAEDVARTMTSVRIRPLRVRTTPVRPMRRADLDRMSRINLLRTVPTRPAVADS